MVFLFAQWIRYELSFEECYPDADRIYQVQEAEKRTEGIYKKMTLKQSVKELPSKFPIVEQVVNFDNFTNSMLVKGESILYNKAIASPNFLNVFPLRCIAGSTENVKKEKSGLLISEEAAIRFYGSAQNALGQEISEFFLGVMPIVGVVEVPKQSIIQFDILEFKEWAEGTYYIKLKENMPFTEQQQLLMGQFLTKMYDSQNKLVFEPIKRLHLYTDNTTEKVSYNNVYFGSIKEIRLLALVVILIVVLAIINYVNTSTARAISRAKEVGVRKIGGATRGQLIVRFLIEAFIITSVAMFLAVDIAKIVHHPFENVMGNTFTFNFDAVTIVFAVALVVLASVLAGGYAAFYLSSLQPMNVLLGGVKMGAKNTLRKVLLGFQFGIAIGIIISTWFIYRQLTYMLDKDLGFDKEDVYMLDTSLMYNSESFITELQKNPAVIEATMAAHPPFNVEWGYSNVGWSENPKEANEITFSQIFCDHRFAKTFALEVVQGEFIPSGLKWWQETTDDSYAIVINETFKKLIGVDNPIGITVSYGKNFKVEGKIIGVVKDFFFRPMNYELSPLIISFDPESTTKMFIKINPKQEKEALQHIQTTYNKMCASSSLHSTRPFLLTSLEKEYKKMYQSETRLQNILTIFSAISVIISFLGIISMVAFIIEKRTKEIGIRKINGATWTDIVWGFWKEFLILIAIAAVPSVALSYLFINDWLAQYVYHPSFGWWIFAVVPISVALVTMFILFIQVQGIARKNPIECLKSE